MIRLAVSCLALLLAACTATQKVRYVPARWLNDSDRKPIDPIEARGEYKYSDVLNYQIYYQLERATNLAMRAEYALHAMGLPTLQEALNANNFDEVADSSWFTNRLGRRAMSTAELRRGPNQGTGPDPTGPWIVTNAKTTGATPGFVIQDQRGDKYVIKFDPAGYPELGSGAEIVGTKVMYAMGFNVPENYIVIFHPRILTIAPDATTKDDHGNTRPFRDEDLQELFTRIAERSGGEYRALASKLVEGKPLGPFPLRGTRHGDKNDDIPHEHRRELRGYRVFSAFLNNNDVKEANTLDSFITTGPGKQGYVRHYLLDLSNSLGSKSVRPKEKEHHHDYTFNAKKVTASFLSLGIYQPNWDKYEDPNIESVGMFESKYFKPQDWRPTNPHPAFMNMTERDAFWATKILMKLSDADIRAIVEEAKYTDPAATNYVVKTLIERRDKIGNYYFLKVNPLDDFTLVEQESGLQLAFEDLFVSSGLKPAGSLYRYRLTQAGGIDAITDWADTSSPRVSFPADIVAKLKAGKYYLVQLKTRPSGEGDFTPVVDVVLKKEDQFKIMGLNRHVR